MLPDEQSIAEYRAELLKRFTGSLAKAVAELSDEIRGIDETELIKRFTPRTSDFLMRKNLTATLRQRKNDNDDSEITARDIYKGIIADGNFYRDVLGNPYRLAWLITPMSSYEEICEDANYHGIMRLRKAIMTMELNEKTVTAIAKMVEFFNIRAKGAPVQRVQQTNTNVTLDGNKAIREVLDAGQIEERLKELKAKVVSLPADAVIVDEPE